MISAGRFASICIALVCFFVPFAHGQCYVTSDGGQKCCEDNGKCAGYCIDTTACDNADVGSTYCSTGYGMCCNDKYTSDFASGDSCDGGGGGGGCPCGVNPDGSCHDCDDTAFREETAQPMFLPSSCTGRYYHRGCHLASLRV